MQLSNVSASQVDNFDRCVRYWYNKSILKIPTPTTPQQQRGKDIHSSVENYLRHGTIDPNWKEHLAVAIPNLPQPKSKDVLVEHKIQLTTFDKGPLWIGYIDLIDFSKAPPVRIIDHKTIGDFKWMKKPEDLRNNTQLMSYAHWLMETAPEINEVEVSHVYIGTKKDNIRSKVVPALVDRNHVDKIWARDVEKVRRMVEVAAAEPVTADALPPNLEACGMYGGCPYRDRCNISPVRSLDMADVPADASVLLKKLAEKAAARAAGANGTNGTAATAAAAAGPAATVPATPAAVVQVPAAVAAASARAAGAPDVAASKGIFDIMLADKPVGHTIYNGGNAYTKMPDGTTFITKPTPEQYAAGEAAQTALAMGTSSTPTPPPPAATGAAPALTAAAPAATTPAASTSSLVALATAAGAITAPTSAAPFLGAQPSTNGTNGIPPVAVVPPDAPSRESTPDEVAAATNPTTPSTTESKKRGRPVGSTNKGDTLGKFIQMLMGPDGLLIGLDEVGVVWLMDLTSGDKSWKRLPPPNVG